MHTLVLRTRDFPGFPGEVTCLRWTPDGTALAMTWSLGGFSIWSTFGAMVMCSLCWDYGPNVSDPVLQNPLCLSSIDWSAEGYQLWMVNAKHRKAREEDPEFMPFPKEYDPASAKGPEQKGKKANPLANKALVLQFVKSPLAVNPGMVKYYKGKCSKFIFVTIISFLIPEQARARVPARRGPAVPQPWADARVQRGRRRGLQPRHRPIAAQGKHQPLAHVLRQQALDGNQHPAHLHGKQLAYSGTELERTTVITQRWFHSFFSLFSSLPWTRTASTWPWPVARAWRTTPSRSGGGASSATRRRRRTSS